MDIIEIILLSSDLGATKQFYTHVLGLSVNKETSESISFAAGKSLLSFHTGQSEHPVYHFAFNIPSNSTEKAEKWLKGKTKLIPVHGSAILDFEAWNAKALYFQDNNGNILEFIARQDLDNGTDKEFGTDSILSISEIAVVTDHVQELIDQLCEKHGIPIFSKQPVKENFAACGNDHGLVIISQTDRHWFPTEILAKKFPARIRIMSGGKMHNLLFHQNTET